MPPADLENPEVERRNSQGQMEITQPDRNWAAWIAQLLEPTELVEKYQQDPNTFDENVEQFSNNAITQFVVPHPEARPDGNDSNIIPLDDTEVSPLPERSNQPAVSATRVSEAISLIDIPLNNAAQAKR
jgi:hypothetical protein